LKQRWRVGVGRRAMAVEQVLERIEAGQHAPGGQREKDSDEPDRGQRLGGV